jgi:hypothetical protein
MAGHQGPEAVEEAVRATLQAHLGTYLTAIWAEWGDTLPLVTPVDWLAGEWHAMPDYPVVYATVLDGQLLPEQDGTPFWATFQHRLAVGAMLRGDQVNTLDRQAKRYLWAIWKCLEAYQQLDGTLVGNPAVTLHRYGKSQAFPQKGKSGSLYLKRLEWEVSVWLGETAL